jgi:O-antigen ligase
VRPITQQRTSHILNVAFPIVVLFLLAIFTGLPEMLGILRLLHPILVLGALGLIALGVTGRFGQVFQSRTGKVLTLFTLWFILCIPFAVWRGGSFQTFVNEWGKSYLAFFLTAGLIATASQMKKAFHSIAYAVGFLACLAIKFHNITNDGRLAMGGGRYSNSNELGFALLVGLPFLGYLFLQGSRFQKTLAVFLTLPVLLAIAKTGSRASMLGAAMLVLIVFFQSSRAVRARLVVAAPILFLCLLMVIPAQMRQRYTTFFKPKDVNRQSSTEVEAVGSAEARLILLKDSIELTLLHPAFGVGPGNFVVAQNDLAIARGERKGQWHVTHNTYTQLSCEMGIPGLVIYLAFLYQSWRILRAITRKRRAKIYSHDVLLMAETLRAAFLVLLTVAIFDSYAYNINIPVLAGFITALSYIAARDRRALEEARRLAEEPSFVPEAEFEPAWSGR